MGDGPLENLQAVVPFLKDSRAGSAMALAAVASAAWNQIKPSITTASHLISHTIKVSEKEDYYDDVEDWVLSYLKNKAFKRTTVSFDTVTKFKPMHTTNKPIKFKFDGHTIRATIIDSDPASSPNRAPAPGHIMFRTYSKEAYQALLDKLVVLHEGQKFIKHAPKLYTPTSWGGFASRGGVPPRKLDSVILKSHEIDDLISDLDRFLASEQRYLDLGVPWHRGYLFHGIAGTGKTSIAKALSAEFGMDIYKLSLGDLDGDNTLNDYVEHIKPRSVLLLEDVDVFSAATSREAEEHSATLSGLLNVLDGIATPHGLIKVLTTNHIEVLDEALIRPGRIDVKKEFTALDQDQGERLFEHFYGFRPEGLNLNGLLPSAVTSTFVQHLDAPDDATKAILDLRGSSEKETT